MSGVLENSCRHKAPYSSAMGYYYQLALSLIVDVRGLRPQTDAHLPGVSNRLPEGRSHAARVDGTWGSLSYEW